MPSGSVSQMFQTLSCSEHVLPQNYWNNETINRILNILWYKDGSPTNLLLFCLIFLNILWAEYWNHQFSWLFFNILHFENTATRNIRKKMYKFLLHFLKHLFSIVWYQSEYSSACRRQEKIVDKPVPPLRRFVEIF